VRVIKMQKDSMTLADADEEKLNDILREIQEIKGKLNTVYIISIILLVIFAVMVIASLFLPSS
jgi:hypothetical protein